MCVKVLRMYNVNTNHPRGSLVVRCVHEAPARSISADIPQTFLGNVSDHNTPSTMCCGKHDWRIFPCQCDKKSSQLISIASIREGGCGTMLPLKTGGGTMNATHWTRACSVYMRGWAVGRIGVPSDIGALQNRSRQTSVFPPLFNPLVRAIKAL